MTIANLTNVSQTCCSARNAPLYFIDQYLPTCLHIIIPPARTIGRTQRFVHCALFRKPITRITSQLHSMHPPSPDHNHNIEKRQISRAPPAARPARDGIYQRACSAHIHQHTRPITVASTRDACARAPWECKGALLGCAHACRCNRAISSPVRCACLLSVARSVAA